VEFFPLLRPLPDCELSAPVAVVTAQLMQVFESEAVRRLPNGLMNSIADCVEAEQRSGAMSYFCGAVDSFCQKMVRPPPSQLMSMLGIARPCHLRASHSGPTLPFIIALCPVASNAHVRQCAILQWRREEEKSSAFAMT
jgi:hypothetical protein